MVNVSNMGRDAAMTFESEIKKHMQNPITDDLKIIGNY